MVRLKILILFLVLLAQSCAAPEIQARPEERIFHLSLRQLECDCPPYGFYLTGKPLPPADQQEPGTVFKVVGVLLPGVEVCESGHKHFTLKVRDYLKVKNYPGIDNAQGMPAKDE